MLIDGSFKFAVAMNQKNVGADVGRLPLSESSFGLLREEGKIYVDKTDLIFELTRLKTVFLSRPRRFGKSLLISTLEELFSVGRDAVKGLKAEALWSDRTYPVLSLDFSMAKDCSSLDKFLLRLDRHIETRLRAFGFKSDVPSGEPISRLEDFLFSRKGKPFVLLIDEYDAPLTSHLHEPELFSEVRDVISSIFSLIKGYAGSIHFMFITGVMKFRQANIFSAFNSLTDISLSAQFGKLLGITEDELRAYFWPYIENAGSVLGLPPDAVIETMRAQYDGYCFDEEGLSRVFAPWSVLSFLAFPSRGFQNYWFQSAGTPAVIVNYLKSHSLLNPIDFDASVEMPMSYLTGSDQINELDYKSLLFHAGYLTIKTIRGYDAVLGYPNEEIRDSMARLYRTAFWKSPSESQKLKVSLIDSLDKGDASEILHSLNEIVHRLDYQNFTLTTEAAVRQLVQVFFLGANIEPRIEVHSPKGRSDLEISLGSVDVVFEFKLVKRKQNAEKSLSEAKKQLIEKEYGFASKNKRLLQVAAVFVEEERKFGAVSAFFE